MYSFHARRNFLRGRISLDAQKKDLGKDVLLVDQGHGRLGVMPDQVMEYILIIVICLMYAYNCFVAIGKDSIIKAHIHKELLCVKDGMLVS
jgi:hypothetical protein